jgi:hypothetical protein
VDLDLGGRTAAILNPGSGGQAHEPETDRAACVNVYGFSRDGRVEVDRLRHDGATFVPEQGGAYRTGR